MKQQQHENQSNVCNRRSYVEVRSSDSSMTWHQQINRSNNGEHAPAHQRGQCNWRQFAIPAVGAEAVVAAAILTRLVMARIQ